MEEAKKKKVEIGVIVGCMLITAVVLWIGLGGGGSAPAPAQPPVGIDPGIVPSVDPGPGSAGEGAVSASVANIPQPDSQIDYGVPAVFPASPQLDTTVYNTNQFTDLDDYVPLTITPPEIGRENPFVSY
jgi:hypothetical protein